MIAITSPANYISVHLARFLVVPNGPSSLACSLSPVVLAGRLCDECDVDDGAYFPASYLPVHSTGLLGVLADGSGPTSMACHCPMPSC